MTPQLTHSNTKLRGGGDGEVVFRGGGRFIPQCPLTPTRRTWPAQTRGCRWKPTSWAPRSPLCLLHSSAGNVEQRRVQRWFWDQDLDQGFWDQDLDQGGALTLQIRTLLLYWWAYWHSPSARWGTLSRRWFIPFLQRMLGERGKQRNTG